MTGAPAPRDRFDALLAFYRQRGYGYTLGPGQRPAVLVIDFSRAFTGGHAEFPGGNFDRELAQTCRLLAAARGAFPVLFTTIAYAEDLHDAGLWARKVPWLEVCRRTSALVAIDPVLEVRSEEPVIVKRNPSAFHGTDLEGRLTALGVDTLVVAGCTTSVCVRATVVDAMQHGFRTLVAAEAVGDFVPEMHELHLRDLGARYADVLSTDQVLAYLRGLGQPCVRQHPTRPPTQETAP
jgi:nicotinamidase-related amidase